MASAEIQRLLRPPSTTASEEHALDFINATFKSFAELEQEGKLEHVVEDTRQNADELCAQLQQSQTATDEHIARAIAQIHEYAASARELSLTRHALADELFSLSEELESPMGHGERPDFTLLEELESLHRNLKELESVRNYISVIDNALRLSEVAVAQTREALLTPQPQCFTPSALTQYRKLQIFVFAVSSTCSGVENPSQNQPNDLSTENRAQPLKLVTFLVKIRDRTWKYIRGLLSSKLLEVAETMGWPQAIEYTSISPQERTRFEFAFADLLKLQDLGDEVHVLDPTWKHEGTYPIQTLTTPIILRFKFHFESKRDTNRLDKPEWYFTHILNVTHSHRFFFEKHVQSLLSNTAHKHVDAFREFTLHLLPSLTRKLRLTVPRLLHYPSLLAHTIYQTLAFDASMRDQGFGLERTSAAPTSPDSDRKLDGWEGVSDQILYNKEWFEAWLEGERKFAENQYDDIINASDAWKVADDEVGEDIVSGSVLRPTNSARRVKALIEQITDRYQSLPRFSSRTSFLITIQIPILESYHSRISSSLDAFEMLSSSFVRAVPGALGGQSGRGTDNRRLTSGVEGVGRLVKANLSADFIAAEMEHWGEDLFFLELWAEINSRAALRARAEARPLLPDPARGAVEDMTAVKNGTIFQELVTHYRTLAGRAEDMIVRHVCSEVESAARTYFLRQWDASDDPPPDERGISIPNTLLAPISLMSSHLDFLAHSLPSSHFTVVYRRIAFNLGAMLLQRRITQRGIGQLSLPEAKQVAEECLIWVQACRMSVGRAIRRIEGPWARLLGAIKLVTLEPDHFRSVVERIFHINAAGSEALLDELEVSDLDMGDLVDIVRLRQECWR